MFYEFGGGLKGRGIPRKYLEAKAAGLKEFFALLSEETGYPADKLSAMNSSMDTRERQIVDELVTMHDNLILESMGRATPLNIYAGAELQPCLFPTGSLKQLYGNEFFRVADGGKTRKDIYYNLPGIEAQLVDLVSGELIPKTELGKPGRLRMYNPYNVSHLHAFETEDICTWEAIPKGARVNPQYMDGAGISYYARAPDASQGGYCSPPDGEAQK